MQLVGSTVTNELCIVVAPDLGGVDTEERAMRQSQVSALCIREMVQAYHWIMVVCMANCNPVMDFSITMLAGIFAILPVQVKENMRKMHILHPGLTSELALV